MPARFAEEEVVLPERTTCPPDRAVIEWVQRSCRWRRYLPSIDGLPYPPQVFMAQQAVVFPTLDASFIREDSLFRDYYRVFEERVRRYRAQPFFNAVETPAERAAFVKSAGRDARACQSRCITASCARCSTVFPSSSRSGTDMRNGLCTKPVGTAIERRPSARRECHDFGASGRDHCGSQSVGAAIACRLLRR